MAEPLRGGVPEFRYPVDEVIFLRTHDAYAPYYADAEPRYFEPGEFYGEVEKLWQERNP